MTTPIEFACPHCSRQIKVKAHGAGRTIPCPQCKSPVVVPSPEMAAVGDDDDIRAFNGFGGLPAFDWPLPEKPSPAPVKNPPTPEMVSGIPFNPRPSVRIAAHEASLPASRSYPVLSLIATVCRVLAGIIAVVAVVAMLIAIVVAAKTGGGLADPKSGLALLFTVLPIGLGGLIAALGLLVNAELIGLAIHIQANTLATAHAARRAG